MKHPVISALLLLLSNLVYSQSPPDAEKLLDLMQNQKYREAAAYIKDIYTDNTLSDKVLARLAYCHYMAGNLPEAEKNYLILYKKDTLNTQVITSLANLNMKRGNYPAAANFLKRSLTADSSNFLIYKQLGQIGQITKDTNTVYYLEKANTLNASDPDIAYDLSTMYIQMKKYLKADTVLKKAIEADSTNLLLLRSRAKLSYARDQWKAVIILCNKLISEGDNSPAINDWLGEAYYKTRQFKKCIETFREDEKKGLEKESSLYFIAKSYKNLNDQPNAIKYFRKTITSSISPNIGNYYMETGDSQEKVSQYKGALASYLKSLQYEEDGFTYYMIANLYDQTLKDKKKAATYFKKFISSASASKATNNKQYLDYARVRLDEISKSSK